MDNPYSLYKNGVNPEELKEAEKAQKEIENAIVQFKKAFERIKKKYPKVGMGDTASDEAVSNEVWKALHFS